MFAVSHSVCKDGIKEELGLGGKVPEEVRRMDDRQLWIYVHEECADELSQGAKR